MKRFLSSAIAALVFAAPLRILAVVPAGADRGALIDAHNQSQSRAQDDYRSGATALRQAQRRAQQQEREAADAARFSRIQALSGNELLAWERAGRTDAGLDAIEAARAADVVPNTRTTRRSTQLPDPDAAFRRARFAVVVALVLALLLVWTVQRRQSGRA